MTGEREALLPCPFCGCAMRIDAVARDWWRLHGEHDQHCMFASSETDVPQEPEQLAVLIRDWNRRAALLEPVGEGWVMVPKEPTEAMLDAACDVADVEFYGRKNVHEDIRREWAAMLNAASPKSNGGMGS